MKFIIFLLLFVFFTGCSSMKRNLTPNEIQNFKKVAVVSVLGDKLKHDYVGTTIWGNKTIEVDVKEWKVDELASKMIFSELKAKSKFSNIEKNNIKFEVEDFYEPLSITHEKRKLALKKLNDLGFDVAIVLMPTTYDNAPMYKAGYSLYRHKHADNKETDKFVYMMGAMVVYDTAKAEQIAWQWTFDPFTLNPGINSSKAVLWKDRWSDYSNKEKTLILESLKDRIQSGVEYSLRALNLTSEIKK